MGGGGMFFKQILLTKFPCCLSQFVEVLEQLWLLLGQFTHGLLPLVLGLGGHVALKQTLKELGVLQQRGLHTHTHTL